MIAHSLLEQFELITDTPGNIPLLRRFIIDLAIQGKLIEKNNKAESAPEIIRRIAEKSELLSTSGRNKKQKPLLPIAEDDIPAGYSSHCMFERLGNIAFLEKGLTGIQSAQPGEYPLVVTAESRSACDHFDFEGPAAIIPMVSSTGHGHASLNRLHYQEGKFALGNILCAVFPISPDLISARFLYEYLTAFKEELLVSKMLGTANVSLTIGKIGDVPIPIISPTIQQRVDELMVLCDRLEAAQKERENRRDRLVASSLHHWNNGADADAFRERARFYFNYLPRLTTRPDHIKQLRQTILNLAVRGKLVQQNSMHESPEFLQAAIRSIRGKGDKNSTSSKVDGSDLKFFQHLPKTFPSNWTVCPLEELFKFIDYRGRTPTRTSRGIRLVTAKNVRMGHIANEPIEFIDENVYSKWMTRGFPQNGDLLFVTEGATMGYVGTIDFQFKFALAQRTIALQPYLPEYSRFFLFTLMSPLFQEAVLTNSTGTAVKGIKAAKLKRIRVPFPPLAEQHRIVAKVDELMALCDQLEIQLTTTQSESQKIMEAILHNALNSGIAQQ